MSPVYITTFPEGGAYILREKDGESSSETRYTNVIRLMVEAKARLIELEHQGRHAIYQPYMPTTSERLEVCRPEGWKELSERGSSSIG